MVAILTFTCDNEYYGGNILHWKRPFKWDDVFAALVGLKFDL